MRMKILIAATLASALTVLALATPASSRHGCENSARDAKILVRSKYAVVFEKRSQTYACLLAGGTVYRFSNPEGTAIGEDAVSVRVPQLAGRYFGHVSEQGAGGTYMRVVDLKTGKTKVAEPGGEIGSEGRSPSVLSFVLKPNGSVAWIGSVDRKVGEKPAPEVNPNASSDVLVTTYQVWRQEGGESKQMLDSESSEPHTFKPNTDTIDIAARSIALSDDRLSFYWTKKGEPRIAALD